MCPAVLEYLGPGPLALSKDAGPVLNSKDRRFLLRGLNFCKFKFIFSPFVLPESDARCFPHSAAFLVHVHPYFRS